jgi:hypothetical protein
MFRAEFSDGLVVFHHARNSEILANRRDFNGGNAGGNYVPGQFFPMSDGFAPIPTRLHLINIHPRKKPTLMKMRSPLNSALTSPSIGMMGLASALPETSKIIALAVTGRWRFSAGLHRSFSTNGASADSRNGIKTSRLRRSFALPAPGLPARLLYGCPKNLTGKVRTGISTIS